MKTLTHQQAQAAICMGQEAAAAEREALAEHLAGCAECRVYAALVDEMTAAVPALYPAAAFSEREIRQKASGSRALARRRMHMTRISRGARAFVTIGLVLGVLLALVILSPRLLPGQPGTVEQPTAPVVSPAAATEPAPTPLPENAQIPGGPSWHVVAEGENLYGIAAKYHLEAQTILWANQDLLHDNPHNIQPGQTLRIPGADGLYYRWQRGDTWESVAETFGADAQLMRGWLENQSKIGGAEAADVPVGTELFIPGGKMPLQMGAVPTLDAAASSTILSPDGNLAALYQPGLLRIDDARSGKTLLSGFMGVVNPGNWSPDSRYLLYWENRLAGGTFGASASLQADGLPLWALDARTGETKPVGTTVLNTSYLSWSPDGSQLAFSSGGYRSAQVDKWLAVFDADSGAVTDLIAKETLVTGALAWSPDGQWIAAAAVEGSQTGPEYADYMGWDNPAIAARRIYLVNPQTGEYRRLTPSETYEDAPRWSADGKRLFFAQAQGPQARLMAAVPDTGEVVELGCEAAMPQSAGYYGQVDWSGLYSACAGVLEQPAPAAAASTAEFELYFYRPLVVDYDPQVWEDRSEPDNQEKMVNFLQHRQLESCTIGVRGGSGFYPENMADVTLGNTTYQVYEFQTADTGMAQKIYFFKSSLEKAVDEVRNGSIPILYFESSPAEMQSCQSAAETVFAALRPSERLINMPFCEKLARDYHTPPNTKTYCDADYNFAFDYPDDWVIEPPMETPDSGPSNVVRRAQRFQKRDMGNFIRVDTYKLPETRTLEDQVKANPFYPERDYSEHDYADLRIGGQRGYAVLRRWVQDYSAVYLFFQHGEYYTIMEIKTISAPKLDTNWKIARSIQIPGATVDDNYIPDQLLIDSYRLAQ